MAALNKQALIAKIKKQTESFDTVVLKEDEANALLGELESQQTFQQAFFRQSLMYDVVAEAYEEAKEQIAKDVEIKARLCLESNSLFDRLRAAEKRIAELEAREVEFTKPHAHLIWIQAGHAPDDFWDDVAVSHSEKDRCCDGSERYPVYAKWEIEEMLAVAGIGVKGE